jgi:uncharacterized membrane protein YeiH
MDLPSFPRVDLFAAGINALNATLVARSPKHDRGYTLIGLLIIGFVGGIGGGLTRDVLLNDVPGPLTDVKFLIACLAMGVLALALDQYSIRKGEYFRKRVLWVVKSFTLPWFAILGAHKALDHHLGIFAAIAIGVIATTAGGVLIDLFSGVTPEILRRAEHLVTTAILAAALYSGLAVGTHGAIPPFFITLIAAVVAFAFRLIAVRTHWEEIVPSERGSAPSNPRSYPWQQTNQTS